MIVVINYSIKRLNEVNLNTYGTAMRIIKYNNAHDIMVEFDDEYKFKVKTTYSSFSRGEVKNPYDKTVFGVGYYGNGKYVSKVDGKHTLAYKKWRAMIVRCYSEKYIFEHPTYKDCTVCNEWHNFQNFAEWFENNYYEIPGEIMDLDKDILVEGNKVYSPDTCVIIPQFLNKIFNHTKNKKSGLPLGVKKNSVNRYTAYCSQGRGNEIFCGTYNTPEDAFYLGYLPMKKKLAKEKIDSYKEYLPQKLYDRLINYEIKMH